MNDRPIPRRTLKAIYETTAFFGPTLLVLRDRLANQSRVRTDVYRRVSELLRATRELQDVVKTLYDGDVSAAAQLASEIYEASDDGGAT